MRILSALILVGTFLLPMSFVFAQDIDSQKFFEEEAAIIEPGILPSSFWYWTDIFAEEINYVFTIGKEKKADFLIEVAEERLAELKVLSEEGITKHAERLMADHEEAITKAELLYLEGKEKTIEKVKQLQTDTEMEILKQEYNLKSKARQAPAKYEEGRDNLVARIVGGFKKILSHLSWKRDEIQGQRNEFID